MRTRTTAPRAKKTHPQFRLGYAQGYTAGRRRARRSHETVTTALRRQADMWQALRVVERDEVRVVLAHYLAVRDAGDVADDYPLRNLLDKRSAQPLAEIVAVDPVEGKGHP